MAKSLRRSNPGSCDMNFDESRFSVNSLKPLCSTSSSRTNLDMALDNWFKLLPTRTVEKKGSNFSTKLYEQEERDVSQIM